MVDYRFFYLLNITLSALEECSFIMLLATNLRLENPLVNSRIRKNFVRNRGLKHKNFTVIAFGQGINYSGYPVSNLGNSFKQFALFIQGKYYFFGSMFFNSFSFRSLGFFNVFIPFHLRPVLLLGEAPLGLRSDNKNIFKTALRLSALLQHHSFLNKQIFNVVSSHLGTISLKENGVASSPPALGSTALNSSNFTYLLGTDAIPVNNNQSLIIYQGSHLPPLSFAKGLILPTATYVEHISTFMNLEGRIRSTKIAVAAPPLVLSDMEVIRLLNILKKKTNAANFSFIENFYAVTDFFKFIINYKCCFFLSLTKFLEEFKEIGGFKLRAFYALDVNLIKPSYGGVGANAVEALAVSSQLFAKVSTNYYAMDTLSRNSKIMGLCSSRLVFSTFS